MFETRMTRRQSLLAMGRVAGALAAGSQGGFSMARAFAQTPADPPLREIAAGKGILFGSALGLGHGKTTISPADDELNMAIFRRECAVLVPENEMKIYVIGDDPAKPRFGPGDRIAEIARVNGLKLRGHTLLWNNPSFVPPRFGTAADGPDASAAMTRWLRAYIGGVCRHFGSQVYSWDVVNETVDPSTGALRDTAFTRALGFDALRIAYETARDAAPAAQLVYNDYMSWGAGGATHRLGVLKLLERFKAANVPIDALGVQSHIGARGAQDARAWRGFLDEVVAMGYDVLITEFDVNDLGLPSDIAERDAGVAALARDYLDLMLSYPQVNQFLCWEMVDPYSWLQDVAKRPDGLPQRPLPFDQDDQPKPLRQAIAAALTSAPARPSGRFL